MPTPSRSDTLLALLGTAVVLGGVGWGLAGVRTAAGAAPARPRALPPVAGAEGAGDPSTTRLPAGVRIDPETLRLVGLDLEPEDGSAFVAWDDLQGYEYEPGLAGLPEAIESLDGQRVTMVGFLLPLYEFTDIREFHLVASHWSCCFGVPPGLSGWVYVRLAAGAPGLPHTTDPLRVVGTLRVAEQKEAGYVVSIYALEDARAFVLEY